jgi:hypothetical protein
VHEEECEYDENCTCEDFTKKFTINFETLCGSNLEYKFQSIVTFFANKNDRKNLKKFIAILKNQEKINDFVENSNKRIDQIYANYNRVDLTKNRRLYYNPKKKVVVFNLDSNRHSDNNKLEFNLNSNEIIFGYSNNQRCEQFCSCGDCEYYGRFETEVNIIIPFKEETKIKIVDAFKEVYFYLVNQ